MGLERSLLSSGRVVGYRGEGAGPTIVQVHGLGTGHQNLDALTPSLGKALNVIDVDLPGYNDSDPVPDEQRSIDGFADSVAEFLREQGLGPVALHGSSMGGLIVLSLAARYQQLVSRVVVTVSFGRADNASRQIFKTWRVAGENGSRPLAEVTMQQGFARTFWDRPEAIATQEAFVEAMNTTTPEVFLRDLELMDAIDVTAYASTVAVPTLLIGAADDVMTPVDATATGVGMRGLAEIMPNARLEVVDQAGHFLLFEHPEVVADLITRFVKDGDAAV